NRIMHMQQVERFGFENFDHFCGESERVRRMVEKGIRRNLNFVKMNVRIGQIHSNGRRIADEMNIVAARGEFLAKFCCHDAGAAVGGVAGDADSHGPGLALLGMGSDTIPQLLLKTSYSRYNSARPKAGERAGLLDAGGLNSVTRLAGKVSLITGGGTGIGRGTALAFAREGAKVTVAGRRLEKLQEVVNEIRA